ncbi:MAG: hypothetical protein ACFCVC_04040 [Acidimicrobiia bacterium]
MPTVTQLAELADAVTVLPATDWAAALLARHATVTGTSANTRFQDISLQLNLTGDDPRPRPDSDPDHH